MAFVDEVTITIHSGNGGDGCASFRRERYVTFGGPNGGDGGRGGDVIFVATRRENTLSGFRGKSVWRAGNGEQGGTNQCTGASAPAIEITVPVGTRILDADTDEILIDLTEDEGSWLAATGGRGGLGNVHFKSSINQAPRRFTPGKPGESRKLRLELLLMADVGLLGYPNAGKSTLIGCITGAQPKVGAYPFTTLAPKLGVVDMGVEGAFVIADIPGLIEGAADGVGLGHQFLRHVRRTRMLLHLVSLGPDETEAPAERYQKIRRELARFDPELAEKPEIVVLTKTDVVDEETAREAGAELRQVFAPGVRLIGISAITNSGLRQLKHLLWRTVQQMVEADSEDSESREHP